MDAETREPILLTGMAASDSSAAHDDSAYCPHFQHALELVGRRWTGSILRVIGDRSLRFGEIRSEIPGLSDRLLDARLTELETEGVVCRSEVGGVVRYTASRKGIGLRPVFVSLATWAEEFPMPDDESFLPGRRRC